MYKKAKEKTDTWEDVGGKLKGLAKFVCWLGIISSIIGGIVMIVIGRVVTGFGVMIFGSLFSWMGSWVAYAIGEAAEKSERMQIKLKELEEIIDRFGMGGSR